MEQPYAERPWPKLTVACPPTLMRRIRKAAVAQGLSNSDLVRDAVRRYVDGLLQDTNKDGQKETTGC
jgi:Ribbon-helix-helix protein, copG family